MYDYVLERVVGMYRAQNREINKENYLDDNTDAFMFSNWSYKEESLKSLYFIS